jgi:hypothetical protein
MSRIIMAISGDSHMSLLYAFEHHHFESLLWPTQNISPSSRKASKNGIGGGRIMLESFPTSAMHISEEPTSVGRTSGDEPSRPETIASVVRVMLVSARILQYRF